MSDAASPIQLAKPPVDATDGGALTPEAIDRILGDFRVWLTELAAVPTPTEEPPAVDLHTLVSQFTALRQEVNLQTKAARTSLEQTGETIVELRNALEELRERPEDDETTPLLKSVVDVYDNLALALRQVTKQRDAIVRPLTDLEELTTISELAATDDAGSAAIRPGFWWRLFGASAKGPQWTEMLDQMRKEAETRRQRLAEAAKLARSSFDGLIAGYQMSLNRVDRVLEQFNMESISTEGETFDPELMEVVEVVGDSGRPAGEVVEEVRRGYIRGDVVFRYAQVKVAR